jgi:hypothetical protein
MSNEKNQEIRLSKALKLHPQIKVVSKLGNGNKGVAYLTEDGRVIKITIDREEYSTALALKGKTLKHIIDIYDCWRFKCVYDDGDFDNLFCLFEEYVDTISQKDVVIKFVSLFKHAWFSKYFPDFEGGLGTFDDLNRCMRNPFKYSKAINYTKQFILTEGEILGLENQFEVIYNQLAFAYLELHKNAPKSHLDLNDGNIGFTSKGVLKIFDMQ